MSKMLTLSSAIWLNLSVPIFLTSSFRPEFYTSLGVRWVNNNGPGDSMPQHGESNGHEQPVSPLKRVLLRNIPELAPELAPVINAFDPWARDRGQYYSLQWQQRPGAEPDDSFPGAKANGALRSGRSPISGDHKPQ
jgi:hypothetical protein